MSTPGPPHVRAFVAIELPEGIRSALSRVIVGLRGSGGDAVRWVNPGGIHLTLKFLGDVEEPLITDLVRALEAACGPVPAFSLALGTPGAFPSTGSPRVLWIGLTGQLDSLAFLQRRVEDSLQPLRFPPEDRAFSPHLTLGRVRESRQVGTAQRRQLGQAISACQVPPAQPFVVDGVALIRSQLTPQGAIYTRLHRVGLAPLVSP
ncbi:MAG: RNA 2',3'-cyclic phosphodiesterase [Chloroflexi bacterium]|nr:RNA 2',3'-cyclic phosphodiesterase [Chloroflexota bacterium]